MSINMEEGPDLRSGSYDYMDDIIVQPVVIGFRIDMEGLDASQDTVEYSVPITPVFPSSEGLNRDQVGELVRLESAIGLREDATQNTTDKSTLRVGSLLTVSGETPPFRPLELGRTGAPPRIDDNDLQDIGSNNFGDGTVATSVFRDVTSRDLGWVWVSYNPQVYDSVTGTGAGQSQVGGQPTYRIDYRDAFDSGPLLQYDDPMTVQLDVRGGHGNQDFDGFAIHRMFWKTHHIEQVQPGGFGGTHESS